MIEVPEERQANSIQFSKKEILLLQHRDPDGLLMKYVVLGQVRPNEFHFLSLVIIKREMVLGKCQPYGLYFDCVEQDGTLHSVDK